MNWLEYRGKMLEYHTRFFHTTHVLPIGTNMAHKNKNKTIKHTLVYPTTSINSQLSLETTIHSQRKNEELLNNYDLPYCRIDLIGICQQSMP